MCDEQSRRRDLEEISALGNDVQRLTSQVEDLARQVTAERELAAAAREASTIPALVAALRARGDVLMGKQPWHPSQTIEEHALEADRKRWLGAEMHELANQLEREARGQS